MITVNFNYAKRRIDILKLLSCRTDGLDAVNKLSERNIVLDGTILSVKQTGGNIFVSAEDRFTNRLANWEWIRLRVDVEIFESAKKNLRIKKFPHTSGRGLKLRSHCHFDKVWERHSCDNGKEICQKVRCTFRLFFLFITQTCCMFLFIFMLPSPSWWLLELPSRTSSVTMQNNY